MTVARMAIRPWHRSEEWLFGAERAERLAALRIGLCTLLAMRLMRSVYIDLADQPASLFRPRSFMNLFPSMPPRPAVVVLQVVGVAACIAAALGWRARASLPIAFVCGLVLNGMTTSLGKVVHNDVLLLLCIAPLLLAPTADAWSLDARRRGEGAARSPSPRYGWAVRTALVVVAGAYFFAGYAKLMTSGLDWVTTDNMRWILYIASDNQATPNQPALFIADRPWLARGTGAATLALELAFPAMLWLRQLRPVFAAAAAALHAGIWVTMGLNYWPQAATVCIVLIDWPSLLSRIRRRHDAQARAAVV